jgi:xanthine dehydrogenase molybdopterin-binding subunit B
VQVYADGSVLVSHAGTEMGQGIATKVKQAAAHALGQLLPEPSQRAVLLARIRVAGGCTELLPHAGVAASSTTSEGATVAVTLACEELVGRIRVQLAADAAAAAAAGGGGGGGAQQAPSPLTWEAAVKAVAPRDYLWAPKVGWWMGAAAALVWWCGCGWLVWLTRRMVLSS